MDIIQRLAAGERDVPVIEASPGAIRIFSVEDAEWEPAESYLSLSDIGDHERQSVAEITISSAPYVEGSTTEVSIELTPGDITILIATLKAIKATNLKRYGR